LDVAEFVLSALPPRPARVLEVGCGSGELAQALAEADYAVLGVDPDAPHGPMFRRTTIEELDQAEVFDAVVASRSLHHISELPLALDKIAALLRPEGAVVVDDFGWELLHPHTAARVGIAFDEWRREHAHLHTSHAMVTELDRRFGRRSFSWEPYLHREARRIVSETRERELIEAGEIRPIGFRYVGAR